jgi:outer membrane protein
MKKIGASLMLAATLAAAAAPTNAPAPRALSLQDCLTEALQHNFDVRVERYDPQIQLYNLNVAYAGYDPTLSLSGTHDHSRSGAIDVTNSTSEDNLFTSSLGGSLPSGTTYSLDGTAGKYYDTGSADNSDGSVGVSLTQPLLKGLWMDSTRLNISIAKNNLKYSEQTLRQQLITTITAVENAFYELIYARENLQVQQQALALAQTQLNDDKKRVEVGTIAQSGGTIEQDESEVAQNRANLIAAQFTLASDENTLKNLITDNYPQWHDVSLQPTETLTAVRQLFDVQDSWSKGLGQRPDLLQAKLSVEQQGIQLKYDRNQLYPQLDLKGSYGYNGSGRGFDGTFDQYGAADRPYYSYGAALSLPLSNARARNSLKADKATEQQLLLKLKQLEQNVMVQIDDAVKNAQSAWESVDATQKARIYAEAALKAEQGKYAVGKSTTFTVLQLQNSLTSARSQEIRMVANYNEALASLAQQEGSTLERHQLDLHVK